MQLQIDLERQYCRNGDVDAHCKRAFKAYSHRVKAKAKTKFSLMFEIFFFDLFCLFFDPFRFRVRFCSVWTGP